ncbi:hypothetical protein [Nocardia arthritidis]|uniref:Uncharacterized protein n=1 Tax=Nocardia arthritidis TaxID=228602 RepID=A0A6G9Y6Q2_9NOCA|nr:hypothetical protein [Nocardia arthritidis]QIS08780.1 hypothetical protein F5544_04330 [Nocardia arthritidis]
MTTALSVGICDLSVATAFDLRKPAAHTGVDVNEYHQGLRQKTMSVPAIDEDTITAAPVSTCSSRTIGPWTEVA